MAGNVRIGVDTGGTFTDCVLTVEGRPPVVLKVPSTPDDPSRAILEGITQVCDAATVRDVEIEWLAHGTTVATNAILQRKWSRVGLLTNRGFRDVLEIGTQMRPSLYSLHSRKPTPLVPRDLRLEIPGRVSASGEEVEPLDLDEVRSRVRQLVDAGVEAIAVSLLFSFLDPAHEQAVAAAIAEVAPDLYVCLSSDVSSEFREYPRTSTTVINAALAPVVRDYIDHLSTELDRRGIADRLHIMQSNGGVLSADEASRSSHKLILSGPAAGIIGAADVCRSAGEPEALTFDMGGTSTDVGIVLGGQPKLRFGTMLNDAYPVQVPMLDLHTVGAGGGSIAWIDKGGALKVGPQSAGSVPGPACYGLGGTEPTVTDAYLALGRIDAESRLGSVTGLDRDLARQALQPLAGELGLDVEGAALGILDVATATMAGALRVMSSKRGHDPRNFALVAFGGAGPVHAAPLAKELAMSRILLPGHPGALSACGLLASNVEHTVSRAMIAGLAGLDEERLDTVLADLRAEGDARLDRDGVSGVDREFIPSLDLRYRGQEYALTVPFGSGPDRMSEVAGRFHAQHDESYGHSAPGEPLELVNVRARMVARNPEGSVAGPQSGQTEEPGPDRSRQVFFAGSGWTETPVVDRGSLDRGRTRRGPLVVEQIDTTVVVEPGQALRVLDDGTLAIDLKEESA